MSGHFKTLVSSISIAIIAQAAVAQDLTIAVDVADLEPVLRQASLVATVLSTEDAPLAQDLIAAARADYQRIIAGLYSEGYYGGTVSIRV
ncbi:MAG: outer membrane protein assembly factor, partial [Marivivens sp.]|nr:outer membrane protein assembly factor [Marivivens sp.]